MTKGKIFTAKAKARIARAETIEFGHIRKCSLAAYVQSKVDRGKDGRPPAPAPAARKKKSI